MISSEQIKKLDKQQIFEMIGAQPDQLRRNYADTMGSDVTAEDGVGVSNVILAGMGGSALAANIIKNWLYDSLVVPFEVIRGYKLPDYIGPDTLVILSSYSGNTEETLACYEQALGQNARIVVMTAGGKLMELAKQKNHILLDLPADFQPRLAVFAGLKALACLFEDMRLASTPDLRGQLINVSDFLNKIKFEMSPDNDKGNTAMEIAEKVAGKVGVIYAGSALGAAAYKWKIDINENGKQLCFYNTYPELNHNEFQGWIFPEKKPVVAVQLESSFENKQMQKRMDVTKQILSNHGFKPIVVNAQGDTKLAHLLSTILLGDYVSAYIGIINGINPTPVELVEDLKKKLG